MDNYSPTNSSYSPTEIKKINTVVNIITDKINNLGINKLI